jgi:putative ABC transport system permease protein
MVLNGESCTVVGVVPEMVPSFFRKAQVWVPLEAAPPYDQHGTNYLEATGVLKPGISIEQAQSDLSVIQSQIDKQFPENKHAVELQTLTETLFGQVRPIMLVLLAAVGFILLIACVNLANLMLSRSTERLQEFGIRQALGASPRRLLQQSFTESVLLAVAGGLLGVAIAVAVTKVPVAAWPAFLEAPASVHLSASVLGFSGVLVVLASLIFGTVPALQTLRQSAKHLVQLLQRCWSVARCAWGFTSPGCFIPIRVCGRSMC